MGRRSFGRRLPMAGGPATSRLAKPTRLNRNCLGPSPGVGAVPRDHAGPRRDGFSEASHGSSSIGGCPCQVRASLRARSWVQRRPRARVDLVHGHGRRARTGRCQRPAAIHGEGRNRARATKDIDVDQQLTQIFVLDIGRTWPNERGLSSNRARMTNRARIQKNPWCTPRRQRYRPNMLCSPIARIRYMRRLITTDGN